MMIKRTLAMAAIALPIFVSQAPAAHAQDAGSLLLGLLGAVLGAGGPPDDGTAAVEEDGVQRPIVHEHGQWGYRDHAGRWQRAPEAHRAYMEYHHPGGTGFHPGEAGHQRATQVAAQRTVAAHNVAMNGGHMGGGAMGHAGGGAVHTAAPAGHHK